MMRGVDFTQFLFCEESEQGSGPGHLWDPHGLLGPKPDDDQAHCSCCGMGDQDLRRLRTWMRRMIEHG